MMIMIIMTSTMAMVSLVPIMPMATMFTRIMTLIYAYATRPMVSTIFITIIMPMMHVDIELKIRVVVITFE